MITIEDTGVGKKKTVDKKTADIVMARLKGELLYCPDCEKPLDKILIERYPIRRYTIDYTNKNLLLDKNYLSNTIERSFRCPYCDSLNVDEMFKAHFQICDE